MARPQRDTPLRLVVFVLQNLVRTWQVVNVLRGHLTDCNNVVCFTNNVLPTSGGFTLLIETHHGFFFFFFPLLGITGKK
jgi:hypothetical protein